MKRQNRIRRGCGLATCLLMLSVDTAYAELRAGAAKVDMSPQFGVSLDGPISKPGPVTSIHDPLHARALVLDDGNTRIAIVVCDACMIEAEVFDAAKQIAFEKTGLSPSHMLMSATHTHAAPRLTHIGRGALDDAYHEQASRAIAQAVIDATQNLRPAEMGYANFDRGDLLACRRHLCEEGSVAANPFGEVGERVSSVSGRSSAILKPAGPVDPQFSILSVRHTDGQPLCLLGNFSVHYCGGYQSGAVSADYFGHFCQAIEAQLAGDSAYPDVVGIMSNGTSGNTGSFQRDGPKFAPFEGMQFYGRLLAEQALEAVEGIEYQADVELEMLEAEIELAIRKPTAERLAWAESSLAKPKAELPHNWSRVYAQEAQHLSEFPNRRTYKLQALRIGDVAIAACPCEVFAETGLWIKQNSPFKKTFTMELANGYGGYLPPKEQHDLGGYETWPARSSHLEVDAEHKIKTKLIQLLGELSAAGPGVNTTAPFTVVERLRYSETQDLHLDLFLPKQTGQSVPCVIVIQGGGFNAQDGQKFRPFAVYLAEHGFAAALIAYRGRPNNTYQETIADTKAAVRCVRKVSQEYHIDPDRIGAMGRSAGGTLAAMLAVTGDNSAFDGTSAEPTVSSSIQAAVAMAGVFDLVARFTDEQQLALQPNHDAKLESNGQWVGRPFAPDSPDWLNASAQSHVDARDAPILFLQCKDDSTVPWIQSRDMHARMRAAGVDSEIKYYETGGHGFSGLGDLPLEDMVTFFRQRL